MQSWNRLALSSFLAAGLAAAPFSALDARAADEAAPTTSGATLDKGGKGNWLTVGTGTAKDDGTGSIDFAINNEVSPDAAALKLEEDVKLSNGAKVEDVQILAQGDARIDFSNAKPGSEVEAHLPQVRATELMLEEQKLEQDDSADKID